MDWLCEKTGGNVEEEQWSLLQKASAEALGIFFLVFVGAGTAAVTLILGHKAPTFGNPNDIGIGALGGMGDWLAIGLAFGFVIMAMIYSLGHVSGAHINPAVTFALLLRKHITLPEALAYWVAQFIGATLGAFAIALVYGHQAWTIGGLGAPGPFPGVPLWRAGVAEAIGQFGLVLVVFGVAVNKKAPAGWAGLIIGLNIAGLIILLGNVSGAAINPARTVGPMIADAVLGKSFPWTIAGVYVFAQLIGAAAAAAIYPWIAKSRTGKVEIGTNEVMI